MALLRTRFGKIYIAPEHKWEPIYRATESKSGQIIDYAWFCPHCGREFNNRKACKLHCFGKLGSFVATCPYLRIHQCSTNCEITYHIGRKYAEGIYTPMSCPTHKILKQTFSIEEMRYYCDNRESLHICSSCYLHFEYRIHRARKEQNARDKVHSKK